MPSKKQDQRQAERSGRTGQYEPYPKCYRCGKTVGFNYASHPMTDCVGDDGENWGDTALVLCDPCYTRCDHMRNASEFRRYKETGYY